MSGYVLSQDAERDLNDLWDYIGEDSPSAADRLIETLFEAFSQLADFPGMGTQARRPHRPASPILAGRQVSDYLPR
jgi:plasmid stabilization system protein ParE